MFRYVLALVLWTCPAWAELPIGQKAISLKSATENIVIGSVEFKGAGATRSIRVTLDDKLFKDHFLSMRPFKCLEGTKFYCHLPYPYEWRGTISEGDFTDLEYALLFVQKEPSAYGINLWHGIYYKLSMAENGSLAGVLHEVDMDSLASPPPPGTYRPLTFDMLTKADPAGQWLPELVIE